MFLVYKMYPTLAGFTNQRSIDNVAATLYPDDAPLDFKPVTCYRDGNCLFRAFSIIFFGNEDHHTEFCIRAVCELAKNEKDYLSNYYLHSLMGAKNVVENLLPSSVFVNVKDSSSSYRRDVLRTLKSFTFAHMWHMFSLANVLGCTVQSVYPDVQNPGTNRFLLDISIRPAVAASTSTEPSVRLMWSNSSNSSKRGCGPNHFFIFCSSHTCWHCQITRCSMGYSEREVKDRKTKSRNTKNGYKSI